MSNATSGGILCRIKIAQQNQNRKRQRKQAHSPGHQRFTGQQHEHQAGTRDTQGTHYRQISADGIGKSTIGLQIHTHDFRKMLHIVVGQL